MVDDDQHPLPLGLAEVEQHYPPQRPPCDVEAPLRVLPDRLDPVPLLILPKPGKVHLTERSLAAALRDSLSPLRRFPSKPHPQRVVVSLERLHSQLEDQGRNVTTDL